MIADALDRVPANNYEAAEMLGVSEGTIRRWREGVVPDQLRADTRHALERFLEGRPAGGDVAGDAEALEMPEVWERIDAAYADTSLSPSLQSLRVEQILAAGRMALQHKETALAGQRTRLIDREIEAAESRTQLVGKEVEGATARALALQAPDATAPAPGKATPEETAAVARQAIPQVPQKRGGADSRRHGAG